ncbi:hypothetical protein [Microbacterium sp. SLBN-146]|uniref:hypothetical protein n=1 Tax=Microbacterium sp. SLBN-146 TaxID=2768457 RepID=UPI001154997A|nr:hypothetical protein [Microbacterium sp. SLBN-146]TQJ30202.1 hypothetical protein FBY39_0648 [Microbacterium sp. SLBN-146]
MRTAAILLTAAALAGCTVAPAGQGAAATPAALPDGIDVGLIQLRSDVAAGEAQVRIVNGSTESVEIGAVEIVDARFADAATRTDLDRTTTVRPGATVDIRVVLPRMACDSIDGAPTARLELAASGDIVEAPVDDLLDVIAPLHDRECRAERLADAAHVDVRSFRPSPPGQPAELDLAIAPTGRATATVVAIQPTNLLMFEGTDAAGDALALGLRVDEGSMGSVVTALPIVPARCDPHVVQEDKRGTVFTVEVELDGEPGEVEVAASPEMRARILSWVTEWCA